MTDPVVGPAGSGGSADPPETDSTWFVYHGDGREPHTDWALKPAPPWRVFAGEVPADADPVPAEITDRRVIDASSYLLDRKAAGLVNAALLLRRPLLVTGGPGSGKSTLAYSIAYELALGDPLYWPITSRSTLGDGLYSYDAIGRLQETSLRQAAYRQSSETESAAAGRAVDGSHDADDPRPDIGDYLRLGPLGTALVPADRPRVLLIDEIDKSDIDLPNDLLSVLERGEFTIPELERLADDGRPVRVKTADSDRRVPLWRGLVRCAKFPIIVLTSNGERPFPQAFLRRCIPLELERPKDARRLREMVDSHFSALRIPAEQADQLAAFVAKRDELIEDFLEAGRRNHQLAVDQLLNALYFATAGGRALGAADYQAIREALMRPLNLVD